MLRPGIIAITAVSLLYAGPAFSVKKDKAGNICKDKNVVGSYTQVSQYSYPDYYGVVRDRTYVHQLNLNAGGTALLMWTASRDLMINGASDTVQLGSWTCRYDGKLLVTTLAGVHSGIPADDLFPGSVPDIALT